MVYQKYPKHNFGIELAHELERTVGFSAIGQSSHYLEEASIAVELIDAQLKLEPDLIEEPWQLQENSWRAQSDRKLRLTQFD